MFSNTVFRITHNNGSCNLLQFRGCVGYCVSFIAGLEERQIVPAITKSDKMGISLLFQRCQSIAFGGSLVADFNTPAVFGVFILVLVHRQAAAFQQFVENIQLGRFVVHIQTIYHSVIKQTSCRGGLNILLDCFYKSYFS